jgi:hypothetical protein
MTPAFLPWIRLGTRRSLLVEAVKEPESFLRRSESGAALLVVLRALALRLAIGFFGIVAFGERRSGSSAVLIVVEPPSSLRGST